MADWPLTLPTAPLLDRFQETLADTALRTSMEQGPAKLRQRTTAGVALLDMTYLLTGAQAATLEGFYKTTLAGGTLAFAFLHPRRLESVQARFRKPPRLVPRGGQHYMASVELEVLP